MEWRFLLSTNPFLPVAKSARLANFSACTFAIVNQLVLPFYVYAGGI
ncbi:hypothetical protein [Spirosoma sp. KCTC 42546]|nr:hypothetical protein [Spirosoma sp. KCTC 42546]